MCWLELGSEAYRLMQEDWLEHAHPFALMSLLDIVGKEEEEGKEEKEEEEVLFHSVFYFPIPSKFFFCIFLTREGRWFRPALKPPWGRTCMGQRLARTKVPERTLGVFFWCLLFVVSCFLLVLSSC